MKEFTSFNKRLFILIPLVGILVSVIFVLIPGKSITLKNLLNVAYGIITTAGIWSGCMVIVTYLWKKYPWEHNPVKHLLIEIPAIIIYTTLFSSILYKTLKFCGWEGDASYEGIIITILITLFITSIHEAIFFYRQWEYNFSKSIRLEKDNIEARYETLKSQINPHFLFNSLNGLITLVEDNRLAVQYIESLSDFLRYILKSREQELVSVKQELDILKKYIHVLKLRFGENLKIDIRISEQWLTYNIPPLTLQILLENCIKHNIISSDKPLSVSVFAKQDTICIENNLQRKYIEESTGQGLQNLFERFQFFTTRQANIEEKNNIFRVCIPLLTIEK